MNHFIAGFANELTKHATALGALGSVGKFVLKRPLVTLGAAGIGASTYMASKAGREKGLRGGEEGRMLHAGLDENGNAYTSPTAYTNLNKKIKNPQADKRTNKRVSKNYDEKKFKR
jgi:hypothetical protein